MMYCDQCQANMDNHAYGQHKSACDAWYQQSGRAALAKENKTETRAKIIVKTDTLDVGVEYENGARSGYFNVLALIETSAEKSGQLSLAHATISERDNTIRGLLNDRDLARSNVAEANGKIRRANELIEELKSDSQGWRDQAYKRGEQVKFEREEKELLREKLNVERQTRVPNGAPVYMIDAMTAEALKDLILNLKREHHTFGPAAPQWQTMETAPKDRSLIFYHYRDVQGFRVFISYSHKDSEWNQWVVRQSSPSTIFNNHIQPTHWMPLPEPPK